MHQPATMATIHDPYNLMHWSDGIENFDYKESVTKVYPNALCFMFNHSYCIMEIDEANRELIHSGGIFGRWPECYSRWQETPYNAWVDAYERIQLDLLKKLEA